MFSNVAISARERNCGSLIDNQIIFLQIIANTGNPHIEHNWSPSTSLIPITCMAMHQTQMITQNTLINHIRPTSLTYPKTTKWLRPATTSSTRGILQSSNNQLVSRNNCCITTFFRQPPSHNRTIDHHSTNIEHMRSKTNPPASTNQFFLQNFEYLQ